MPKSNGVFLHGECVIVGLCTNIMKYYWEGFLQAKYINLNVRGESIDLHMTQYLHVSHVICHWNAQEFG